jgi:DNA-binding transcriptional ArsR family regulator
MAGDETRAGGPEGDPEVVRLDAASLRVMAHPLRTRLLAALRLHGPSTATGLAARLGTNSGATSYHLRQLAEVGLVEEDPELGNARERWWRAGHRGTTWRELDFAGDPDDRAAAEWLVRHYVRQRHLWAEDWLDVRDQWPQEWRDAADLSDVWLDLTPDQLEGLVAEVHEVVERYRGLNEPGAPGTTKVAVVHSAFPAPEPRL